MQHLQTIWHSFLDFYLGYPVTIANYYDITPFMAFLYLNLGIALSCWVAGYLVDKSCQN